MDVTDTDMTLTKSESTNLPWTFSISLPFPNKDEADMILSSITVEKELHPTHITRKARIVTQDSKTFIIVDFASSDLRHLRISVNSIFLKLSLGIETIRTFSYISEEDLISHPDILPECAMKI